MPPKPADKPPNIVVTVRVPEETHDRLREAAFSTRRTQQSLILEALDLLFAKIGKAAARRVGKG